jgi:hypothetical protein
MWNRWNSVSPESYPGKRRPGGRPSASGDLTLRPAFGKVLHAVVSCALPIVPDGNTGSHSEPEVPLWEVAAPATVATDSGWTTGHMETSLQPGRDIRGRLK